MLARVFFSCTGTIVANKRVSKRLEDFSSVFVFQLQHLCPKVKRISKRRNSDESDSGSSQRGQHHVVQQPNVHVSNLFAYDNSWFFFAAPSTSKSVFVEKKKTLFSTLKIVETCTHQLGFFVCLDGVGVSTDTKKQFGQVI